jgi:catalase
MAKGQDKGINKKAKDLDVFQENAADEYLTTNQGLRINDDQNSLKAGERGPSLLEDFHLRETITLMAAMMASARRSREMGRKHRRAARL